MTEDIVLREYGYERDVWEEVDFYPQGLSFPEERDTYFAHQEIQVVPKFISGRKGPQCVVCTVSGLRESGQWVPRLASTIALPTNTLAERIYFGYRNVVTPSGLINSELVRLDQRGKPLAVKEVTTEMLDKHAREFFHILGNIGGYRSVGAWRTAAIMQIDCVRKLLVAITKLPT